MSSVRRRTRRLTGRRLSVWSLLILLVGSGLGLGIWAFASMLPSRFALALGRPWAMLLLIPGAALLFWSWRPLAVLGRGRRILATVLRGILFVLLVVALADLHIRQPEEALTVMIVLDRSLSMPQELQPVEGKSPSEEAVPGAEQQRWRDRRWERLTESLRQALRYGSPQDRVGVVLFAGDARLEFPPTMMRDLNFEYMTLPQDRYRTDIAQALRLAMAAFPETTARRILLVSDGNENAGHALQEADVARLSGIPIDVVPARYERRNEVALERLDPPSLVEPGRDVPLRLVVRNYSDSPVTGTLHLWQYQGDRIFRTHNRVQLDPGLNVLQWRWPGEQTRAGSFSLRAFFVPDRLPEDRAENNETWTAVLVRRRDRQVLVVAPNPSAGQHQPLLQALTAPTKTAVAKQWNVHVVEPAHLPAEGNAAGLELLYSADCVVLCNVPAWTMSREQQEALRKAVRDQGLGLVVIGGRESFGAGGWQGEPLEEAFPVDPSLKSVRTRLKGGLVLVMHAGEHPQGNYWEKEVAKLAVQKLGPMDEVGVICYRSGHEWHIPLQPVGPNRQQILDSIASMVSGDMPQFDPALRMAHEALTDPKRALATRHIIFISDGDHGLLTDFSYLQLLKRDRVTLTTVGITTHGPAAQDRLAAISMPVGGRHYAVNDARQLPAIYIRETQLVTRSYTYEGTFAPEWVERGDPLRTWKYPLPELHGYVRTMPKSSPLVQLVWRAPVPDEDVNPLLVQWQYGLGRVVAFTSDVGSTGTWAAPWRDRMQESYQDFWQRIVEWAMRSIEDQGLTLQTRWEQGWVVISVLDDRPLPARQQQPIGRLEALLSSPGHKEPIAVELTPTSAGVYEGTVDLAAEGTHMLTVRGSLVTRQKEGSKSQDFLLRGAVTLPSGREFAAVRSNEGLLAGLARGTGGRVLSEDALGQTDLFLRDQPPLMRLLPVWHWLLLLAAWVLFFDVAVRRLAIHVRDIIASGQRIWRRLRGTQTADQEDDFLARLRRRKAEVAHGLPTAPSRPELPAREAAAAVGQRTAPTVLTPEAASPEPTAPAPTPPAPPAGPAEDFATRLKRAKQKALEEIQKRAGQPPAPGHQ